ncbi:MAG: hypothetical protein ACOYOU_14420 [Kiritimatiellia bacterium]
MKHVGTGASLAATGWLLASGVAWVGASVPARAADPATTPTRTVVTREVKTMEDACDLKKGLTSKSSGLIANPKSAQGPKAPYAEGSFSSAAYRENATSDLRRRHDEAFGAGAGASTNDASSNAVANAANGDAPAKGQPADKNPKNAPPKAAIAKAK